MEASALRAPAGLSRLSISLPLLRLRSDDQLLALFRAGSDEAFNVLHDRYRQRLFAYVRQMLSAASRQDAEDVLQDVFVRAFGALRADARPVNVRAWLYRVAHNRCIDHLRRPVPAPADVFEMSRTPLHDPLEDAQRREDLRRLVDRRRAPARPAALGAADARDRRHVLRRPRHARSTSRSRPSSRCWCARGSASSRPPRRARPTAPSSATTSCPPMTAASRRPAAPAGTCASAPAAASTAQALRSVRSSFAALSPGVGGAAALMAKLFGIGGGGAAAGGAAASGGGALAGGGVAVGGATACKVAAVACAAALTAGGAVEVKQIADHHRAPARAAQSAESAAAAASRPSPATRQRRAHERRRGRPGPVRRARPPLRGRARRHPRAPSGRRARTTVLAPPSIPIYEPDLGGATAPDETLADHRRRDGARRAGGLRAAGRP